MAAPHSDDYGFADPTMLNKIDSLFACGAGSHVDIPQIVVVGDQSSGKSSVLGGLIRRALPRDSGLCTRFATKIVFRRSDLSRISVSILADKDSSAEHKKKVDNWGPVKDLEAIDDDIFRSVMEEVYETIGVSGPGEEASSKPTFSRDVLQLEISGPDQEHLSVIDVPGIFRNPKENVTTKDDIALVRSIVNDYMVNRRSVMLVVISANIDLANQEILELAKAIDPEGDRTLGVLTKPDLVDKGTEPGIIALVEGRADKLKLGWHLVRNPGQAEVNDITFDRLHQEEVFFSTQAPWNKLDPSKVGIDLLRLRLREVLTKLVRKEFSKVKLEVNKKLSVAQDKLRTLGPERDTRSAQMAFLTDLSTRFQELARLALDAKQGRHRSDENSASLRIAPRMVDRMKIFKVEMSAWGHQHAFEVPASPRAEVMRFPMDDVPKLTEINSPETFAIRKQESVDDLRDLLHEQKHFSRIPSEDIDQWLQQLYQDNKGFELGTFDPAILFAAMRDQCIRWPDICLGFVSDAVILTHNFITAALDTVCQDDRVYTAIHSFIVEGLRVGYTKALEQAKHLLEVEIEEMPWTEDHYFNEYLNASRKKNWYATLECLSVHDSRQGQVVSLENLQAHDPIGNSEFLVRDIHDILHSYYRVTQKRIVDNMCKQAAIHFLLSGPATPFKVFSPQLVSQMTDEQLEQIAGEEPTVKRTRIQLGKEIASLKEAKSILV